MKPSSNLEIELARDIALALKLKNTVDPHALVAGLFALAELVVGMRDGTHSAPPAEVTLGEVVIAAVKGALEDKLASH